MLGVSRLSISKSRATALAVAQITSAVSSLSMIVVIDVMGAQCSGEHFGGGRPSSFVTVTFFSKYLKDVSPLT